MQTLIRDPLIGERVGHYQIERLIGVGGMAHVYLARDTLLGREVAIKALAPEFLMKESSVRRFRREAQRVAALAHPHIAPILHMIEHEGRLYLVMPLYVESLRERLQRAPSLEVDEAMQVVSDVGSALAVAHEHGLVHRDVKPGNILLDQHGRASLCDFGIACKACVTDDADTLTLDGSGLPAGTPLYMAPEQLRGAELDHRADIYALAVVLYQMLTGTTPHTGKSLLAVAASALTDPIMPPSALNPAVTPLAEGVIMRALSKRPADRYATVTSFVEALEAAALGVAAGTTDEAALPLMIPVRSGARPAVRSQPAVSQRRFPHRRGWLTLVLGALALTLVLVGGLALANMTGPSRAVGPTTRIDQPGFDPHLIPTATATTTTPATQTRTPNVTATPAPNATATATPKATQTPAPRATATQTPAPRATATPNPTATPAPNPTATPAPKATATPAPRVTGTPAPNPTATATPAPAATVTPTATATATSTATPQPPATTPPAPVAAAALPSSLSVSALHLVKSHGNQCAGTQTITNNGAQTLAWQWVTISPAPHPSLAYWVNAPEQTDELPIDRSSGVAPGGAQVLNVRMKCTGQSYTVTLRDSLGRTQQFTMTSDA